MDVCFQAADNGRVFPFLRDLHVFHQTEAVKPGESVYYQIQGLPSWKFG